MCSEAAAVNSSYYSSHRSLSGPKFCLKEIHKKKGSGSQTVLT